VVRAAKVIDQTVETDRELLRRFSREKDQGAFETLVNRHTSMVLGVCRRSLPTLQDAEDACQATFLVLAKRAKDGRWQESVANWLYTTARKVARNARIAAERRTKRETSAAVPEAIEPVDRMTGRELLTALDEALDRLSPRYREPLVLCYLEGLASDEAATRLGIPLGTLYTRIDRARKRLHKVLTKAGCALGAGLLALAVSSPARASYPRLVKSIMSTVSGSIPAAVGELAKGVAVNGVFKKTVLAIATVLSVVGLGVALASIGVNAKEPASRAVTNTEAQATQLDPKPNAVPPEQAAQPANKPDGNAQENVTYSGRVLGPDGKPVAGAKLYIPYSNELTRKHPTTTQYSVSDADGWFKFKDPKLTAGNFYHAVVAATAPNHGIGWVEIRRIAPGKDDEIPRHAKTDNLTIQLAKDDMPITGQIITLEGKPVPGACLTVVQINASPKEDLGPWLEAVKNKKGETWQIEQQYFSKWVDGVSPSVTTDTEGRFKLTGIGSNRLVTVRLEGPTIATQDLCILSRVGDKLTVIESEGDPQYGESPRFKTYYGASFRHPTAPTKPVIGVVLDKDTKKPLAGATIQSEHLAGNPNYIGGEGIVRAVTDKDGRYRLVGMPKGEGNRITVVPPSDQPYLVSTTKVANTPGLEPVTVDFELKRGIWIEGRITDKATGKPLQASVGYFALLSNPSLRDHPGFDVGGRVESKEDGSYRVAGLPGSGFIVVSQCLDYLRVPERDDEYGMTERSLPTAPYPLDLLLNYSAIAAIEPKTSVEMARRDVPLDPGWTFSGKLLDPDGKPLTGARGLSVSDRYRSWSDRKDTAEFTVRTFNPRQTRDILFQHLERGLVGVVMPPTENGGSVTVKMQPGATVTGRLLDEDGKPRAGVELKLWIRTKQHPSWENYSPAGIQTDKDGRFRVEALVPGFDFALVDIRGSSIQGSIRFGSGLRSGKVKELGDVRAKEELE
jgi:RNA polymerase sigma factor (sigma-70 family)